MQPPEDAQAARRRQRLHRVRDGPREFRVELRWMVLVLAVSHEHQNS
jgi:hypothetical protein